MLEEKTTKERVGWSLIPESCGDFKRFVITELMPSSKTIELQISKIGYNEGNKRKTY
jgi:hypothetical protein